HDRFSGNPVFPHRNLDDFISAPAACSDTDFVVGSARSQYRLYVGRFAAGAIRGCLDDGGICAVRVWASEPALQGVRLLAALSGCLGSAADDGVFGGAYSLRAGQAAARAH